MRLRAFSICVSATLAAGLIGVSCGTASADPADPDCVAINGAIQGQLASLASVAVSNPAVFIQTAPGILSSVQALRTFRPDCGGPPVPTIDQLLPQQPAQPPSPQADPSMSCGEAIERDKGQYGAGSEALYEGLLQVVEPLDRLDKGIGLTCILTSQNPREIFQNTCYFGKNIFPADPIYAGIAGLGEAINVPVVTQFGQSARESWSHQCQ
jgi:hypothetical protein